MTIGFYFTGRVIVADAEGLSELSVCLVKKVVFSVGLIIMASAVIGVHLMQKFKREK